MKTFYLVACVAGVVLPYAAFVPWLFDHGVDPVAFVEEAVELRIGLFAWLDVLVSAVVLLQFAAVEGARLRIPRLWMVTAATLLVGVSFGLPLFLLLRERALERRNTQPAPA